MIYTVITAICLLVLILEVIFVIVSIITKKRSQRIKFIRSFKKGKCAVIFLTAIPLYCIGHIYKGSGFLKAFFSSLSEIFSLVVLKYDIKNLEALMNANSLYNFTIYFTFTLVCINAIMFAVSLTLKYFWGLKREIGVKISKKDELVIIGNNPESLQIYSSDDTRTKMIVDNFTSESDDYLYLNDVTHFSVLNYENFIEDKIKEVLTKNKNRIIVINTNDDEKNMIISRYFIKGIGDLTNEQKEVVFSRLKVFVFGDKRYQTIYDDIVKDAFGCISFINKYHKIAMDYINKYPLTLFMDERHIDYETSLIKDDVDINVCFIGFGKTNQQVFLTSVANNQFITKQGDSVVLKKVNYHIFDKCDSKNDKNLNHSYYRYKNEIVGCNEKDYLPFPSLPAEETYYKLDINDVSFYAKIKQIVSRNKNDANFIVIGFGSDLENVDMAQKIVEKRKEWGLNDLTVFVKVRKFNKEQTPLEQENCYFIGNEKEAVYDISKIVGDDIYRMAKMRNEVYELEYAIDKTGKTPTTNQFINDVFYNANKGWYISKTQLERESSIYCCLSLRSKLNLLGLDYVKADDKSYADCKGLTESEFLDIYAKGDMPNTQKYTVTANGKKIVDYPLDFKRSKRGNLAILEHLRWNSFMISKGVVPSTKWQIENETIVLNGKVKYTNGKNYAVRRHGNLTTFDGLIDFRKIVAKRDNQQEIEKDVIKYDYQILDDAHWLLATNGYKIIKIN